MGMRKTDGPAKAARPATRIRPTRPGPADPTAAAVAAALAFTANVRQRVARLWADVVEFRELADDPAHPLHGVFAAGVLFPLSAALEHADQVATDLRPAVRVDAPDLHDLRPFGG